MSDVHVKTYRVQGFSCASCAALFEKNVKQLTGVTDAAVNFGASKITVYGETSISDLEKAGAFENLKVRDEKEHKVKKQPFWKQKENIKVFLSAVLLILSWVLEKQSGEQLPATLGYAAAMIIGGYTLFLGGIKNILKLTFDMKTLMTIAIIGAAIIGKMGEGATVVILFAISEALERFSLERSRKSIELLMDMAPKKAIVRRGSEEKEVRVEDIRIGDVMIVKPGQKLAMDGIVIKGASTVNQAAITGESIPVSKTTDDQVFAGTLNEEGLLEVRVTNKAEDNTISKIIHLVEEAQAERAPSQAFIDRFAKFYTPAIMILALVIAVFPPLLFNGDWSAWIYQGLATLVVGCPCALVVSTPVAVVSAIGNAARSGVLIKGGIHLENMGKLKAIAFDKTGTLTQGAPVVTDVIAFGGSEREWLTVMAAMEKGSQHPLAAAVLKKAEEEALPFNQIEAAGFQSITGKGVKAVVSGTLHFLGSPNLFESLPLALEPRVKEALAGLQAEGKTVMILGTEKAILLMVAVKDELRSSAKKMIRQLQEIGIKRTVMLTGDHKQTAEAIGQDLGIANIKSGMLPENKWNAIQELRDQYQVVAMVGDGVNDAPALAAANVGVAMGEEATDAALETADIVLMSGDLEKLPYTIRLSRRALAIIKQNITFSLLLKLAALLLVVPGWLTLWIAIFADMGATLLVTLNSLRLSKIKR